MSDKAPAGLPPSYAAATGSSTTSSRPTHTTQTSSHLQIPKGRNGIPPASRRSMEDEARELPSGWIRQYDSKEGHQFFVDTKASPPRSIWHHPYDDDQYLSTLSSDQRERLQEMDRLKSHKHLDGDTSDEDDHHEDHYAKLPPRPGTGAAVEDKGLKGFGRKMKDKMTNSTHEEREEQRRRREEEERQYYEAHQKFRMAMDQAMTSGEPVFFAKDKDGRDVYVEPPGGPGGRGYAPGGTYGSQRGRPGAVGINPYSNGPYADPNARFIRPQQPYARPYGYGYGGGMYGGGMGMGMPMMGGMMGGMMLGGLLF